jgi:hypothetical protein
MKTNFITKLYYKKYPYKIVVKSDWVCDLKFRNLDYFKNIKENHTSYKGVVRKSENIESQLHLIESAYEILKIPNIKTRTEFSTLTFFIEDKSVFEKIKTDLFPIVYQVFVPYNDIVLQELLNKNSIEIRSNLTHGCRYKIVLKNTRSGIKEENIKNFLNLIERNQDQFVLAYNAKYALMTNRLLYLDNSLIYVKDSKFLMMLQMMIQPIIKEVVSMFTYEEITNKDKESE